MFRTIKEAEDVVGGLSTPEKMPCLSYGLPARRCNVGSELRKIPGSVCSKCYAHKGRYGFIPVLSAQEHRYQKLEDPRWTEAMVWLIKKKRCKYFRWHDSGDIKDLAHLTRIVAVARQCPKTKFWLPTRERACVSQFVKKYDSFPSNLTVRVSGTMVNGKAPIAFSNTSTVVSDKNHATCPAHTNNGKCGTCRQCWDRRVRNVSYPAH